MDLLFACASKLFDIFVRYSLQSTKLVIFSASTNNLPNYFNVIYTSIPGMGIATPATEVQNPMKEHGVKPLFEGDIR